MGKANSDLLDRLAKAVVAQGPHFTTICGGDFQNPPNYIAAHSGISTMRARVVASESLRGTFRTTRNAANLDFFTVSENLAMAIDKVELQEGTGTKSHVPVQIVFKERPVGLQTLALRMPPPLLTERQYGPLEPELDWSQVATAADAALAAARAAEDRATVQAKLNVAYSDWCDLWERDIMRVTGAAPPICGTRGKRPQIKWRSILPENKSQGGAESRASILTWVRGIAREIYRVNSVIADETGSGLFRDPPFRGGNMPYGGTFAAPVRGGYGQRACPPPLGGQRGGRPRPPSEINKCIDILREVIEDLADGRPRLLDHSDIADLHARVARAGRSVLGKAIELADSSQDLGADDVADMDIDVLLTDLDDAEKSAEKERDKQEKDNWVSWLRKDLNKGGNSCTQGLQAARRGTAHHRADSKGNHISGPDGAPAGYAQ